MLERMRRTRKDLWYVVRHPSSVRLRSKDQIPAVVMQDIMASAGFKSTILPLREDSDEKSAALIQEITTRLRQNARQIPESLVTNIEDMAMVISIFCKQELIHGLDLLVALKDCPLGSGLKVVLQMNEEELVKINKNNMWYLTADVEPLLLKPDSGLYW